jgi:hypothetical protein
LKVCLCDYVVINLFRDMFVPQVINKDPERSYYREQCYCKYALM